MARSRITSVSQDRIEDNTLIVGVTQGEQIQLELTINWVVNLNGYAKSAKIREGLNDGRGTKPCEPEPNGIVTPLQIIDTDINDNIFSVVIPATLADLWEVQPTSKHPSYGFIEVTIADTGVGVNQQIWKPFRGLVEVYYPLMKGV